MVQLKQPDQRGVGVNVVSSGVGGARFYRSRQVVRVGSIRDGSRSQTRAW